MSELLLTIRLGLGAVFALAALGKLRDPRAFVQGIRAHDIVPHSLAILVALLVIVLEGFLTIAHFTGWLLAIAVPLGVATFLAFAGVIGVNLRRGRLIPCYCFGSHSGEKISLRTLSRTLFLAAAETLLLAQPNLFRPVQITYPLRIGSPSDLVQAVIWATFAVLVGSWLLLWPEISKLVTRDGSDMGTLTKLRKD